MGAAPLGGERRDLAAARRPRRELVSLERRPRQSAPRRGTLSRTPPQAEAPDSFVYDPADPGAVPWRAGYLHDQKQSRSAMDQREAIEARQDVLVYSSEVLEKAVTVAGPYQGPAFRLSSAPDTDVTAKLVDVQPDGRAFNVQEGILAASAIARGSSGSSPSGRVFARPRSTPWRRPPIHFGARPPHPHRDSSSNFPRFDRNMKHRRTQCTTRRSASPPATPPSITRMWRIPRDVMLTVLGSKARRRAQRTETSSLRNSPKPGATSLMPSSSSKTACVG